MVKELEEYKKLLEKNDIPYQICSDALRDGIRVDKDDLIFTCINGLGTYGGVSPACKGHNAGLLEFWCWEYEDPIGWLTGKEAFQMLADKLKLSDIKW